MCLALCLVLMNFLDNNLLMVVYSISTGAVESTVYLNSEVPRSQQSHHDTKIIHIDVFEFY